LKANPWDTPCGWYRGYRYESLSIKPDCRIAVASLSKMFKHFTTIEERTTCGSCDKKLAGVYGEEMRMPLISPCICTFCKGCLLVEEANAQQQQGEGDAPGVGHYTHTPCMYCGYASDTPVAELKRNIGLMKRIDANAAAAGGGGAAAAAAQ